MTSLTRSVGMSGGPLYRMVPSENKDEADRKQLVGILAAGPTERHANPETIKSYFTLLTDTFHQDYDAWYEEWKQTAGTFCAFI